MPLSTVVDPLPGQFYMLGAGDNYDPLIKRPLSIFNYDDTNLQFLFRIRGKGTAYLAKAREGEIIDLVGPLGNGYPPPDGEFIAIAGGIGIASLMPFLRMFRKKATLFYGARNRNELVMVKESAEFSLNSFIATDDGSVGEKGLITNLFTKFISSNHIYRKLPIYSCGSMPMLKALAAIVESLNMQCYASIEEHMACGVGACLGCVVMIKSQEENGFSYKTVCKDGPVLQLRELIWR